MFSIDIKSLLTAMVAIIFSSTVYSQQVATSPASQRSTAADRKMMFENSLFAHVKSENIGPTIFNGRVTDLEVNPDDPTEFYVAYATGGLWHTKNNGLTFTPLFQNESVITIGDIAVHWTSGTIYLGSGEQNSSRSSYAGNGVYKSTDKGKTWSHLGLEETHHISKIVLHPSDPGTVWVAAMGHLYSSNPERGVFMTTDGGQTWSRTLFVNDDTGASDIIIHPDNPSVLYAAAWQRSRKAWNFKESGSGSGIHKSTDGGKSWTKITGDGSGFVNGEGCGRIGLALTTRNNAEFLYAIVDNNFRRPKTEDKKTARGLTKEVLLKMSAEEFLKQPEDEIKKYFEHNDFPEKYTAKKVMKMVKEGKVTPKDIATYGDNANTALFETPVTGAEVYLSKDMGHSWVKTHKSYLDDVYFTYGYYFGQIRVAPGNPDKLYIFGVPVLTSDDGGKTWKNLDAENVHGDHHALWINPRKPGHIILGNDGGVNISYDDGENWFKCTHPEVGQFYYINTDLNEPYNIYGGTQDNGVWMGAHTFRNTTSWHSTGEYPYKMILGGDGMQVQIDNRDNSTIYAGFQFGNYFRINRQKKDRTYITPKHDLGKKPYRWNWQTPILLSAHNQDILYMGANILLRSMDQGKDFTEISNDLTSGGMEGNVPYGTITTIDESKLKFGLIYTGTDDGLVHITRDGGVSWQNISEGLPKGLWVSRVQASAFDEGTVYISLNGYRNDHFRPYLYTSSDYGKTWTDLSDGLPGEPVNVVKEDPADADILYVGTDHGTYVSLDKGLNFQAISSVMPSVPVHDLTVQPKARHLLVGTHGRSIYKINVENLPELKSGIDKELIVFGNKGLRHNPSWGAVRNVFTKPVASELEYEVYSKQESTGTLEIWTADKVLVKSVKTDLKRGLATYTLDMKVSKEKESDFIKWSGTTEWVKSNDDPVRADDGFYYLLPGKYKLRLVAGKADSSAELLIK